MKDLSYFSKESTIVNNNPDFESFLMQFDLFEKEQLDKPFFLVREQRKTEAYYPEISKSKYSSFIPYDNQCDCEKEELVEEKTYSEESFQKIIEGFYKEQFKTLAEFKLNNVTKTEEGIQVEGTLVNKFGKTRDICLEGKCIQKGKSFLKYRKRKFYCCFRS